jgi:hypothetical protein
VRSPPTENGQQNCIPKAETLFPMSATHAEKLHCAIF